MIPADLGKEPIADQLSSRLRAAFDYWSNLHPGCLPARRDIDPLHIPALLPWVILVDVLREPAPDFRVRLIGSGIAAVSTRDRTGQRFSENPDMAAGTLFWQRYAWVRDEAQPLVSDVPYVGPEPRIAGTRQILLPLSDDGAQVNIILACVEFLKPSAQTP